MSARYKPIKALASGGMADVWLGLQISETGFNRLCAIKTIKKQSNERDEEFVSMFRDEASICQALQHANVVQVYDFTVIEDGCALIMEYVQGINLATILRKFRELSKPFPNEVIAYIGQEIAKGLHYVHTRKDPLTDQTLGIVHRDISPSNILISVEGEVKITDFGIAKAKVNNHETQVGVVKGKFQYMSPEQFRGETLDHKSDIYALGCILWECAAGRRIYEAESDAHLIQLIAQNVPRPNLKEINPALDDALIQIIERCLETKLQARWQSGNEIAVKLGQLLSNKPKPFSAMELASFVGKVIPEKLAEVRSLVKEALSETSKEEFTALRNPAKHTRDDSRISDPSIVLGTQRFVNAEFTKSSLTPTGEQNSGFLKWHAQNPDQTVTRSRRQLRARPKRKGFVVGFLTFAAAVTLVSCIVYGVAQFGLKIDINSEMTRLNAKILEKFESIKR